MKKIVLSTLLLLNAGVLSAQFKINIEATDNFSDKKAFVYTLNGSKDILNSQVEKKKGKWEFKIPEYYKGMMKVYFPETNQSIHFISENKDIEIKLLTKEQKIVGVNTIDESNKKWNEIIELQRKKEEILPVLVQIKTFYNDGATFSTSLSDEIKRLESTNIDLEENTFLKYYLENVKYTNQESKNIQTADYKKFIINSGDMLESSSLMKPILINFLRGLSRENLYQEIDTLLDELNLETSRGQTVLSELLSIFEAYGLNEEKERYYQKATALTCSINKNLETSLKKIKNTAIGATFEDYTFTSLAKNVSQKKLSQIKSAKKIVLFWSSTCPHCLSELPIILENYSLLKDKGIELIALSLDTDKKTYEDRVNSFPWINDTELKGWQSSFVDIYNVHGTPTYYVLDDKNKIIDKPVNFSTFLSTINAK